MLQNQRMLTKLGTLLGQVDEHEEALAREKDRGDRLEKELQRLKQLYPAIEDNESNQVPPPKTRLFLLLQ
jgi:uncharacterized protein YcbK (DUF882 family)